MNTSHWSKRAPASGAGAADGVPLAGTDSSVGVVGMDTSDVCVSLLNSRGKVLYLTLDMLPSRCLAGNSSFNSDDDLCSQVVRQERCAGR